MINYDNPPDIIGSASRVAQSVRVMPTSATVEHVEQRTVVTFKVVRILPNVLVLQDIHGDHYGFDRATGHPHNPTFPWRIHKDSLRLFKPVVDTTTPDDASDGEPTVEQAVAWSLGRIRVDSHKVTNRGSTSDVVTDLADSIRRELLWMAVREREHCEGAERQRMYDLFDAMGGDPVADAMNRTSAADMATTIREHVAWLEQHARGGVVYKAAGRLEVARAMLDLRDEGGAEEVVCEVLDMLRQIDNEAFALAVSEGQRSTHAPVQPIRADGVSFDFTAEDREAFGRAAWASCRQHAPWEALHEGMRESFRMQGEVVARVALSRKMSPALTPTHVTITIDTHGAPADAGIATADAFYRRLTERRVDRVQIGDPQTK